MQLVSLEPRFRFSMCDSREVTLSLPQNTLLGWFFFGCVGSSLLHASLVGASGDYSSLWCTGFSLRWLLLLRSMGSRVHGLQLLGRAASVVVACGLYCADSVVVAHGLCCSTACRIFPEQGSNLFLLHWQADS